MHPLLRRTAQIAESVGALAMMLPALIRGDSEELVASWGRRVEKDIKVGAAPIVFEAPKFLTSRILPVRAGHLLEGLAGDPEAQFKYEAVSLVNYSSLPPWGKARVAVTLSSIVPAFSFNKTLSELPSSHFAFRVRDSAEREKWLEDARVGEYSALWLNSFLTYRNALILVGLLDSLPVQSKLPPKELEGLLAIEDTKLRHDKAWNLYGATPVAHGPLGQATRDMLRGLLPFLLRIRLVDDLLLQNRVTLSTQGYSQLLRGHERPWELMALRQTGRLLATAEFLDQVSPFLSHQERSKLVEAAMGAKDPIARTKQALGIATVEAQEVREEILLPKVALLPNVRHFLKETLAEKHAHPDPALMARKLAKLYEHGHCTLEQIVSGLEKNSAPEDLLESLYLESTLRRLPEEALSRAKPAFDPLTQKPAAAPTDAGIQITFTPEFEEWRAGLDSENAARVEARLYRASEGNLGDSRGVRGKLTELRLHHGAGLRIYLRREGPSKATILFGGTKSTQAEDIEHSLRLANLSAESEQ